MMGSGGELKLGSARERQGLTAVEQIRLKRATERAGQEHRQRQRRCPVHCNQQHPNRKARGSVESF